MSPAGSTSVPDTAARTEGPSGPPRLTVVVPCYNEAGNVERMAERLSRALDGIAWEAVFVDDNSPDGTSGIAKRVAAQDSRIRCIRRVGRRGLASACVEGMLSSSAEFVAVIDGDGQHDETILPRMLRALESGEAELVVGSRHVEGGDVADGLSPIRKMVSDAGGALARALLPSKVADPMSGFFMLPRALAEEVAPRLNATGFKILLDILLSAGRPLRVAEVPYRFRQREAGESKLDALVLIEFLGLLLDKALGGWLPLRFISFAAVGAIGVLVHLIALAIAYGPLGLGFEPAQAAATLVAMTTNFLLNNNITYRDRKLRGRSLWLGLVLFYVVCGVGAVANVGIADMLLGGGMAWEAAGAAGALLTVVWNYAVSSTLVWRDNR